jgi:hypothetical protein
VGISLKAGLRPTLSYVRFRTGIYQQLQGMYQVTHKIVIYRLYTSYKSASV